MSFRIVNSVRPTSLASPSLTLRRGNLFAVVDFQPQAGYTLRDDAFDGGAVK